MAVEPLKSFAVDVSALLGALTEQFPNPLLCVRELVQNAADAGSSRVAVEVSYDAHRKLFRLEVKDDGSGMGADEVEAYLTIGFSDKDPRRHRGRFGIGKLSPYALDIARMTVETSDGSVGTRITFRGDGSGSIDSRPPQDRGTTVRVYKECTRERAEELGRETFELLVDTCAGLPLVVAVNGVVITAGGPRAPTGRYVHVFETNRVSGCLGIHADPIRRLSSGGIVLESGSAILGDSVSYDLESPLLSPTLSRNAVRRDGVFDGVLRDARAELQELTRRVVRALDDRITELRRLPSPVERNLDADDRVAVDWVRQALLRDDGAAAAVWEAPVLETADGNLVSAATLGEVAGRESRLAVSRTPLGPDEVAGYADRGVPVLLLYRDLEDFLVRAGYELVEVDAHVLGPEVGEDAYGPGERALLRDDPRPSTSSPVAFRSWLLWSACAVALGLSVFGFDQWLAEPRSPDPDPAMPVPALGSERSFEAEEAPEERGRMLTVGVGVTTALLVLLAGSLVVRRGRTRKRRRTGFSWRSVRRVLLHPRDFWVARRWARHTLVKPAGLDAYRELMPEPETTTGRRLDLDQTPLGFVDLMSAGGEASDVRVLVLRGSKALLNRNHPTVRRLLRMAENDRVRARMLLDALLAADPDLARDVDPRQAEWELVSRNLRRFSRAS